MNADGALRRLKFPFQFATTLSWRSLPLRALWSVQAILCSQEFSASMISAAVHCIGLVAIASWMTPGEALYIPETSLVAEIETIDLPPAKLESLASLHTTAASAAGSEQTMLAMQVNGTGGQVGSGDEAPTLELGVIGTSGGKGKGGYDGVSLSGEAMLKEFGEVKTEASFFGVKAAGRKFAFVVDTSGSMGEGDRWLRARLELERSLLELGYGQEFYVAYFNHTAFPMPAGKITPARPVSIKQTINWLHRAIPAGGTEPWPALTLAMAQKPEVIFLLTDGLFDSSVIDNLKNLSTGKRIPIFTIGFAINTVPPDIKRQIDEQLSFIARMTGGTYREVP